MTEQRNEGADPPEPRGESEAGTERREGVPPWGPRQPRPYPDPVDDALDDSFPASDPPSWSGR